jgi:hypothetical protein
MLPGEKWWFQFLTMKERSWPPLPSKVLAGLALL